MRSILHIDMDAFFASVEELDNPSLKGAPLVVGGPSQRGVVCAANYIARKSGVHSAMPIAHAMRRCPQAVIVRPRHERYSEVSKNVFDIFRRYTPLVEGLSLDEAFLDVTGSRGLFGEGEEIARLIKSEIEREIGLVASAGVASNKFIAKIASDLDKPNGLVVVKDEDSQAFLSTLPIERMWGLGPVASKKLRSFGLETIGSVAKENPERLELLLGKWGRRVYELAQGRDPRDVEPCGEPKSIGAEQTFERNTRSRTLIEKHLLGQVVRVARRLNQLGVVGYVVALRIKDSGFQRRSAQMTLNSPVFDTDSLWRIARHLLDKLLVDQPLLRLVGISVSSLSAGEVQPSLFEDPNKNKREKIQVLSDDIVNRFGKAGLTRGTLLRGDE